MERTVNGTTYIDDDNNPLTRADKMPAAEKPDYSTMPKITAPDSETAAMGTVLSASGSDDAEKQSQGGYFKRVTEQAKAFDETQRQNYDRYKVKLRPEQYEYCDQILSAIENPDERRDTGYKLAQAFRFAEEYDMPLDEAYARVDMMNQVMFGPANDSMTAKGRWEATADSFEMGKNTLKQGFMGLDIMRAELSGETAYADMLKKQYGAISDYSAELSKSMPDDLISKVMIYGAQSVPFTVTAMGAAMVPVIGPALSFAFSSSSMAGLEYMDLREMGASPEAASGAAAVMGGLEGLVEVYLGNVAGAIGAAGSEAAGELVRKTAIDKVTSAVARKLHYSGGMRVIANTLIRNGMESLEEGAEEAVQEAISLIGKHLVAETQGLYVDSMTAKEVWNDLAENFAGGFYGSILLGSGNFILNSKAAYRDYREIKKLAEEIPSEEVFKKAVEESPAFEGMKDDVKTQTIHEIYEANRSRREEKLAQTAGELAEVYTAEENAEVFEDTVDENGNVIEQAEITPEFRDNGRLYHTNEAHANDDGTASGTYRFGDGTKTEKNRYGRIEYTVDEEAGTVTINEFKTTAERGYLRNEMFADFAADFSGYDIIYRGNGNLAQSIAENLASLNPRGKAFGLNYFASEEMNMADADARASIARELRENLPGLKSEEISPLVAEMEALGKTFGKTISGFYNETFSGKIFGDFAKAENAALAQNAGPVAGGVTINDTVNGLRAVIYAGQNADFTTFSHELAHVGRRMIEAQGGSLLEEMNRAFGIGEEGWTREKEEDFAYGFEDYLHTGKAKNSQLKELFQKLAEFMVRAYNALKGRIPLSDDVVKVYDQLLSGDDSVLRLAEEAAARADAEEIAERAKAADNKNTASDNNQAAETDGNAEADIKNTGNNNSDAENAGGADDTENKTSEDVQKNIQAEEAENPDAENKREYTGPDAEYKRATDEALDSIINDDAVSESDKKRAVLDAEGEKLIRERKRAEILEYVKRNYSDRDYKFLSDFSTDDLIAYEGDIKSHTDVDSFLPLFQIIGATGAENLDGSGGRDDRERMRALALEMEARGATKAEIKKATGWERDDRLGGQWTEIADGEIRNEINLLGKLNNIVKAANLLNRPDGKADRNLVRRIFNSQIALLNGNATLGTYYNAPELYRAYPGLRDIPFSFIWENTPVKATLSNRGISVNMRYITDLDQMRSAIIHEAQHVIQVIESGDIGSGQEHIARNARQWNTINRMIAEAKGADYELNSIDATREGLSEYFRSDEFKEYYFSPEEIQARNAQNRRNFTESEKRSRTLESTEDMGQAAETVLFQLIGENGAKNLDEAEDRTERLDNLSIAVEMESAGKDAKTTRLATGWEKGADGKWRYEIKDPEYLLDIDLGEVTPSEWRMTMDNHTGYIPLTKVFKSKELFNAYPQLKEFDVGATDKPTVAGYLKFDDRLIYVNIADIYNEKGASALLHEIQHAIQEIEGFARGGNLHSADSVNRRRQDEFFDELSDIMLRLGHNRQVEAAKEYRGLHDKAYAALNENNMGGFEATEKEISDFRKNNPDFGKYLEELGELHSKYFGKYQVVASNLFNGTIDIESEKFSAALDEIKEQLSENPSVYYNRLAGEVEARNVQRRYGLTADERRRQLLRETEDVSRGDQIVLFQSKIAESQKDYDIPKTISEAGEILKTKLDADGNLYNKEQNIKALVSNKNIKKMLNDDIPPEVHAMAIANLDRLFEKGLKAWSKPDRAGDPNIRQIDRFVAPLEKDGAVYIALMTVKEFEHRNPNQYGLYTVEEIDIKKDPAGLTKVADADNIDLMTFPLTESVNSLLHNIDAVNINSSDMNSRDAEYKEAVESGNLEKARKMLEEEAEKKGYLAGSDYQGTSAFNGAAPTANAYFETKDERLEALRDGTFEDTQTLGDFAYDNADLGGLEYSLFDPRAYGFADDMRKESISNLRDIVGRARKGERNLSVKMYRSVPANIQEEFFRPGDWITPSRTYAEDNAKVHGWGDDYRIIEQEVPLEHLWWDGNDIAEWGFDDESENNVFRNTRNNRKKLEITYDEDGRLIPLSERFNEINPSILFQTAPATDTAEFKEWFKDSVAVNPDGSPKIYYHGTNASFDIFEKTQKNDAGWLGKGFYFFGETAREYAGQYGKNVMAVYLSVQNPYYITDEEHMELADADSPKKSEEFTERLKDEGYDAVYYNGDLNDEFCVFYPEQIKSATDNNGNFDSSNPSILFQASQDIFSDALRFDDWHDFMDWCEESGGDAVPDSATADWYMDVWERAHQISPTTLESEKAAEAERAEAREKTRRDPVMLDAMFNTVIKKEGALENFMKRAQAALSEDPADYSTAEEAETRDALVELQAKIRRVMRHGSWQSNMLRVAGGRELTDRARAQLLTLIRQRPTEYRDLFADLTGDAEFRAPELREQYGELSRDAERYSNLAISEEEIEEMSPEKIRKLAERIKDDGIRKKVREGKLKMDDPDLERYIQTLEAEAKEGNRRYDALKAEIDEDIADLGNRQERDILKNYREFLNLKAEADERKIRLPKGSREAERLGEEYERRIRHGMSTASFEGIYRNYDTLKAEIEANVKAQERLRAENKIEEYRESIRTKYNAKKVKIIADKYEKLNSIMAENRERRNEAAALNRVKELRKKLVKRTMRRVPFTTVDYDTARTVIAVQRVFEPNMRGGINRWIGTEGAWARDVWSAWRTDEDAKNRILDRLSKKNKTALIQLLENTRTEEEFERWSKKDRQALEKAMPKQDWTRELKLDEWKKERDGSIQMDINEVTKSRWVTKADGTKVEETYETAEFGEDIQKLLDTALGPELSAAIVHRPFAEWTTGELEDLAARINRMLKDGRDLLRAKREAEKMEAERLRSLITDAVRDTGIVINDDDPEDVKKKKRKKIDKILGVNSAVPGTEAFRESKKQNFMNRILHGYHDANIRRVARILDNWSEGTNTALLYWRENDCYNAQERAKDRRHARVDGVMNEMKIKPQELAKTYKFDLGMGGETTLTADNILMLIAAQMNNEDYKKEQMDAGIPDSECEEDSAFQAMKYGNLITQGERDNFRRMDEEKIAAENERLENLHSAELAGDKEKIELYRQIDSETYGIMPGTSALQALADARLENIMARAGNELAEKYRPLIDAIRADYDEEFDRLNRASIDEFNMPVWKERRYLPLIRLDASGADHESRVRADLLGRAAGTGKAGVEKGFTKKRIEISPLNQTPVELGLYRTWADSVERNEHFIAYAGYVRELNRVYDPKNAMMTEISARYGEPMKQYIESYIKEAANPDRRPAPEGLDRVARSLRGNTAPAYLAWKFSSIAKQAIESPAPFMQFVNPIEYAKACIDIATSKDIRQSIDDKSEFMKNRTFDPVMDLVNEEVEKNLNKPGYVLKKIQQTGMAGLEWIDWACVAPGWLAIYRKEYARLQSEQESRLEARTAELMEQNEAKSPKMRMSEEELRAQAADDVAMDIEAEAVNAADDKVRLSQPSSRSADLAPMFKNSSEVAKAVLQFQAALNVIWQNIRYDIPYALRNKEFRQVVGMVIGYVMAGIISGLVTSGLGDDDEPDEVAKKIGYFATTQFVDSVPIVGSSLDTLAEKVITGEGGGYTNSSLWASFDKMTTAAGKLSEGKYKKAAALAAEGIAISTGLPVSGAKEALRAVGADGEGIYPQALLGQRKN